jgi:CelD/BcsL family acetyltransferase involved in cellulose biosynthesis
LPRSDSGRLRGRVVRADRLAPLEIAHWDDLCMRHSHLHSPFLSPHYCLAVARCLPRVYVCVIEGDAGTRAFLPFQFRTPVHEGLGSAERVGEEMTDYFGLVAPPEFRVKSDALLRLCGLHYLQFSHLDETQLAYGLTGEQPEPGYQVRIGNPQEYWDELRKEHKNFVKNVERGMRQVESHFGPIRFTLVESDWRSPLEHLVAFKTRQYLESGRFDLFATKWKRRLLDRLGGLEPPTCSGIMSTLFAGETWLASHFGLRSTTILHYWFPVYNAQLSRFGPGHLLLKKLLDSLKALGVGVMDYGAGTDFYKSQSANRTHSYFRGAWRRAGFRSDLCRATESVRWRMARAFP